MYFSELLYESGQLVLKEYLKYTTTYKAELVHAICYFKIKFSNVQSLNLILTVAFNFSEETRLTINEPKKDYSEGKKANYAKLTEVNSQ